MTQESINPTLPQIADWLQAIAHHERYRCICGAIAGNQQAIAAHRQECQLLRYAIIGDIIRVANMLNRTPTYLEYQERRSKALPGMTIIVNEIFESWGAAVIEARLKPIYKTKLGAP